MQTHTELFGITEKEYKLVEGLTDKYQEDMEELQRTSGEAHPDLPYESYLDQCETKNGQVCFRTQIAVDAVAAFLMTDGDEVTESMEAEFLALGRHSEVIETPACLTLVHQVMVMNGLLHARAAHRENAALVDEEFADTILWKFFQAGDFGNPRLSAAIKKFIDSKS